MKLYNTLTRTVQEFEPLDRTTVKMYVCGPTVYDDPHIGHARSAYIFEVLRRYLEYKFRQNTPEFQVKFVRNVTDVDDKIINAAREALGTGDRGQGTGDLHAKCREIAERYLKSYHDTLERLGLGHPTEEPRATHHVVPDMTDLISKLLVNGVAYESGGDVYFSVRKFPDYGRLSNRTLDDLQAGARVEPGEHKRDPLDFALWKAAKPGEPSWKSPWGEGRPGWHIECTVMSTKYLDDEFDIHGGGVDLVFPHHENEIAQAHAVGKPFARYWIHNGLLTVNGEKMSKSLGNFITVEAALRDCKYSDALKIFFLSGHYRSPLNYTPASVAAAKQRYDGYRNLIDLANIQMVKTGAKEVTTPIEKVEALKHMFLSALDDDLDTPRALSALDGMRSLGWELWDEFLHGVEESKGEFLSVVRELVTHGKLFGLFGELPETDLSKQISDVVEDAVRVRVEALKEAREEYRRQKNFAAADRCRQEIHDLGYTIEDTPKGPIVRRKR